MPWPRRRGIHHESGVCLNCNDTGKVWPLPERGPLADEPGPDDWRPCPNGCKPNPVCDVCGDEGRVVVAVIHSPAMDGPCEVYAPCSACLDRFDDVERVF